MVILQKAGGGYIHCHICYMLDGPCFKSWHRQDILFSTTIQTSPVAHPASYLMDIRCLKKPKHEASLPSLHLVPRLRKSGAISKLLPMPLSIKRDNCLTLGMFVVDY